MNRKFILSIIILLVGIVRGLADTARVKFIAELPTPGEYTLFANGGWNGNWYVGYNHGWVSKLPQLKTEGFEKAFIGARLGRAKTAQQMEKILESQNNNKEIKPGPYRILIGISSSKDERPNGKVLTTTDRIPLEGSPVMALEGVTASRWFWVHINKDMLYSNSPNYIHLWSEDEQLSSIDVAPILAAGVGSNKMENAYLINGKGSKVIKFFEPALAIKLVEKNAPVSEIEIESFETHPVDPMKQIIKTKISGEYIIEVGLELHDGKGWKVTGKTISSPPYDMVFNFKDLVPGKYKLRSWVKNWWEQVSYSNFKTFTIEEDSN